MTTNYLGKRPGSGWHAAGIAAALLLAFAALLLAQPPARADSMPGAYSTRIMLTSTAHSATKRAYMRITTTAQEATARVAHASMTAYKMRSTSAAKTATGIYFTRIGTIFPTTPPTPRPMRTQRGPTATATAAINPTPAQPATSTGSAPATPEPNATATPTTAAPTATP